MMIVRVLRRGKAERNDAHKLVAPPQSGSNDNYWAALFHFRRYNMRAVVTQQDFTG